MTINNGTGFLTFGIETTIWPFEDNDCSFIILTDNVRVGLDASSETDRIFAEKDTMSFISF